MMKRKSVIAFIAFLMLGMTACGSRMEGIAEEAVAAGAAEASGEEGAGVASVGEESAAETVSGEIASSGDLESEETKPEETEPEETGSGEMESEEAEPEGGHVISFEGADMIDEPYRACELDLDEITYLSVNYGGTEEWFNSIVYQPKGQEELFGHFITYEEIFGILDQLIACGCIGFELNTDGCILQEDFDRFAADMAKYPELTVPVPPELMTEEELMAFIASLDAAGLAAEDDVSATKYNGNVELSAEKYDAAWAVAQSIADSIPEGSDLERVRAAADAVKAYCDAATYTSAEADYNNAYGLFCKGVYTCAGSTRALGMVLECMGYSWIHVNPNMWTHQWCVVTMDGQAGWADGMGGIADYGECPFGYGESYTDENGTVWTAG